MSTPRKAIFVRVSLATLALGTVVAWASGDWSAAKSKVDELKRKADDVKKLAPAETRKVVAAVCAAADDSRKSAGESAASSARSNVSDKVNELERMKRDAIDLLDHVISDDKLKDHRSEAQSMESDVKQRWDKINDQTRDIRNSRPPVLEYMLSKGENARHDRMGRCEVRDFSVGYDKADCIIPRGDTCTIVSITSDNSNAISKGRDRANRAKSALESELKKSSSDVMKHLVNEKSDFGKCKRVESRVDCYKQCPEIDDDGRFREVSPNWRESC